MDENKEVNTSEHQDDVKANANINPQSAELAKYTDRQSFSSLNLFDAAQLATAEAFLTKVMRSDKGGIKSVNDGLAILMRANDLGLPFSTCIEHIHVINGKTGIDIHIIKALLSRAGCTWVTTKDYQPLYEYTDGFSVYVDGSFPEYVERCRTRKEAETKAEADKDGDKVYAYPVQFYQDLAGIPYREYQINDKFGIGVNRVQLDNFTKNGKKAVYRIPNVAVDYITEYEIFRTINGKQTSAKGRFSYSDAAKADLLSKDTYAKYARTLIGHRAFTYAAREIASDLLFGVMETTELKIVSGKPITSNDLGSVEDTEYVMAE